MRAAASESLYAGQRIVVTGAAGFIGRWVAWRLSREQAELFLFVRDAARASRVFAPLGIRGRILELDLNNCAQLLQALGGIRPAVLFHLAGYGVDRREREEENFWQTNAKLPARLAEAMANCGDRSWPGAQLVHAGSIAEYGPVEGDLREDGPAKPMTLYGKSKLAGTLEVARRCRDSGLRGVIARLATVYGPGEHPGRLLPSLLAAARTGAEIPLSSGGQKRDFTYVEDVADGLLRLGAVGLPPGEVVNLVTGRLTSVREFAETAAAVLGIEPARLRFGALPTRTEEESDHLPISNRKLQERTGWAPPTGIAEGVLRTAERLARLPSEEDFDE